MTVNEVIDAIRPRAKLMELLGVERSRLHEILSKKRPAPAWMLARIAGKHLLPSLGRQQTAEILLATLEQDFPDCFDGSKAIQQGPDAA